MTGSDGTTGSPHEFKTSGGVGITCASMIHGTVVPPSEGSVNVGGDIV
jgi:hypothetical protein